MRSLHMRSAWFILTPASAKQQNTVYELLCGVELWKISCHLVEYGYFSSESSTEEDESTKSEIHLIGNDPN